MHGIQLSDVPRAVHAAPHPTANPGYGKRSAPGQLPRGAADFAALDPRDRVIAAHIDRLPDGADISVKTLATVLPYGQCALRTSLRRLRAAGHMRHGREHLKCEDGYRWVTRTWFSRAAHDDAWWARFIAGAIQEARDDRASRGAERLLARGVDHSADDIAAGDDSAQPNNMPDTTVNTSEAEKQPDSGPSESTPHDDGSPDAPPPSPHSASPDSTVRGPVRVSPAYRVLVQLGRRAPSVGLSAADCAALELLAAEWLARGATAEYILRTLTDGLPSPIHHPAGLIRKRLISKLPPEPLPRPGPVPAPGAPPVLRILECATCRAPGRPGAIIDGECGTCRGETPPPAPPPAGLTPAQVRARVAEARAAARAACQPTPS